MSKPVNNIQDPTLRVMTNELVLVVNSPAFEYGESIPTRFTCDGEKINPPLAIKNVPPQSKSLVLIFADQTIESKPFAHWVLWNIPPTTERIGENSAPGVQGTNDFGNRKYDGPCSTGTVHHYRFTFYALDILLELSSESNRKNVLNALEGHILAASELVGEYPAGER
jgi:Raf kinase inhibitor-like YbhB/YbcL family protein